MCWKTRAERGAPENKRMLPLTDGDTGVGSDAFDVGLRDGSHANLIESPGEESGEGADEGHRAATAAASNTNTDQVLFGDETLNEALWESLLEGDSECGVLRVTIHGHYASAALTEFLQGSTIRHTSSNLQHTDEYRILSETVA